MSNDHTASGPTAHHQAPPEALPPTEEARETYTGAPEPERVANLGSGATGVGAESTGMGAGTSSFR